MLASCIVGVEQMPLKHAEPVAHLLPQDPQLVRSTCMFRHPPEQAVVGEGHPHCPFAQVVPPVHTRLQPPQLLASFCVFTHAPLQSTLGVVHEDPHALLLHTCVEPHAVPQAPRSAGLLFRSTQIPLQLVSRPATRRDAPSRSSQRSG